MKEYVKKKQQEQMTAEMQKVMPTGDGPRAVERVGMDDAINHLAAFKKHPKPIVVLEEMMKRAGMGHDKLKKDIKKFTKKDQEMLWNYCHDIIEKARNANVEEVRCPNGDVMLKTYCENICTKKATGAAFGGK